MLTLVSLVKQKKSRSLNLQDREKTAGEQPKRATPQFPSSTGIQIMAAMHSLHQHHNSCVGVHSRRGRSSRGVATQAPFPSAAQQPVHLCRSVANADAATGLQHLSRATQVLAPRTPHTLLHHAGAPMQQAVTNCPPSMLVCAAHTGPVADQQRLPASSQQVPHVQVCCGMQSIGQSTGVGTATALKGLQALFVN